MSRIFDNPGLLEEVKNPWEEIKIFLLNPIAEEKESPEAENEESSLKEGLGIEPAKSSLRLNKDSIDDNILKNFREILIKYSRFYFTENRCNRDKLIDFYYDLFILHQHHLAKEYVPRILAQSQPKCYARSLHLLASNGMLLEKNLDLLEKHQEYNVLLSLIMACLHNCQLWDDRNQERLKSVIEDTERRHIKINMLLMVVSALKHHNLLKQHYFTAFLEIEFLLSEHLSIVWENIVHKCDNPGDAQNTFDKIIAYFRKQPEVENRDIHIVMGEIFSLIYGRPQHHDSTYDCVQIRPSPGDDDPGGQLDSLGGDEHEFTEPPRQTAQKDNSYRIKLSF